MEHFLDICTIWKPLSFSGISIFIACMEYNQSIRTCQISSRFTKSCRVHEQSIWTNLINLSFPTLQAHPSVPLIDWTDSRRWSWFHHWGLVGLQYTAASPRMKGGIAWDGEHFFRNSYRIYYTFNIISYHINTFLSIIYYGSNIKYNISSNYNTWSYLYQIINTYQILNIKYQISYITYNDII